MKKTSVYLDDEGLERLAALAAREGKSQADVIRAAINAYANREPKRREFALAASAREWREERPPASSDPQAYQDFIDEAMTGFGSDERCESSES